MYAESFLFKYSLGGISGWIEILQIQVPTNRFYGINYINYIP